jgi:hypothetical protein
MSLNFGNAVELAVALADKLQIKLAPDFRSTAHDRLEGTEPTALAKFPTITAPNLDEGWKILEPVLELTCDAVSFLTTNAVVPIAVVLAAADDTFRTRFFPPGDRALIHIGDRPTAIPQIFAAAETNGKIELALSLLRSAAQTSTRDYRIFHCVQALEVLSETLPGGGALSVKIRRLLDHVSLKPGHSPTDPAKDFADVLGEFRNVIAHGNRLEPTTVKPWAADYLTDINLDDRVRDLVRDVIEGLALPEISDPTGRDLDLNSSL